MTIGRTKIRFVWFRIYPEFDDGRVGTHPLVSIPWLSVERGR